MRWRGCWEVTASGNEQHMCFGLLWLLLSDCNCCSSEQPPTFCMCFMALSVLDKHLWQDSSVGQMQAGHESMHSMQASASDEVPSQQPRSPTSPADALVPASRCPLTTTASAPLTDLPKDVFCTYPTADRTELPTTKNVEFVHSQSSVLLQRPRC